MNNLRKWQKTHTGESQNGYAKWRPSSSPVTGETATHELSRPPWNSKHEKSDNAMC
jgi:hypothetical protein